MSRHILVFVSPLNIMLSGTLQLALPRMELGYGRFAKGGRGGDVQHMVGFRLAAIVKPKPTATRRKRV